ncbi:hypothetical protein [Bacteroides heparinolyticus]|uniref:hypothetical protein n=1 Tax=Prevotella heparinolytica TaxID=28113 RepID=UPI00359F3237
MCRKVDSISYLIEKQTISNETKSHLSYFISPDYPPSPNAPEGKHRNEKGSCIMNHIRRGLHESARLFIDEIREIRISRA